MKTFIKQISILSIITSSCFALNFDKHLELSYVKTSGNSNTNTFSAKLETMTKISEKGSFKAKGSALYSENNEQKSANKYDIEIDYHHMLSNKVYSYIGANYVKDQFSDYDYRLNIGPGIGYKFFEDEVQTLDIQGGLDYAFDKYSDSTKDEYIAPRSEINYRYKINENLEFKQMLNYLISLEDSEKYFISSESSLAVKMTKNLSLGVSYRLDHINKTEKEKTDRKFLTSLIMDF
ncbi:DUF481 domain-containing protein [Arcobacter cloacae]|uniref:Uncharacterized protein n=1 Tax=Arcobacter cloacae TaxID=1054034 RepID=A0A6M8N7P8_9BACT|nr:DUF481 domain-containing protein [Arcobacter cloacae]QKF90093.1 DUF481 domain-containing protein [Arcobacter cloacae]RXI39103.1 hypothetical protein CP963_10535 [Arcobacter cloacae]